MDDKPGLAGGNPKSVNVDYEDENLLEGIDKQVKDRLKNGLGSLQGVNSSEDEFRLQKQLISYINSKYGKSNAYSPGSSKIRKGRISRKAKDLISGIQRNEERPPRLNIKEERIYLIKFLVENGWLLNFEIPGTWHPTIFFNPNRLTTYPFQHEEVILYRGTNRHIFYNEEYSYREDERHERSILDIGYLLPDAEGGEGEGEKGEIATYFAFLESGRRYSDHRKSDETGGAIVLETIMDSKNLVFVQRFNRKDQKDFENIDHQPETKNLHRNDADFYQIRNLQDMNSMYGSPINMKEIGIITLKDSHRATKRNSGGYRAKIMAKYYGKIPVENILRVWEYQNIRETPSFMKRDEYIKYLAEHQPEKIPDKNSKIEKKVNIEIRNEIRNLRNILTILEIYHKNFKSNFRVGYNRNNLRTGDRNRKIKEELESTCVRNNKKIIAMRKYLKEQMYLNIDKPKIINENFLEKILYQLENSNKEPSIKIWLLNKQEIEELEKRVSKVIEKLRNALKKEESHLEASNWDKKKLKNEEKFEKIVNEHVAALASEIPILKPKQIDESRIKETSKNWADDFLESKLDTNSGLRS